jgi:hypothetical protein
MCEAGEIPGVKRMPTGAKKNKTWRADAVIFEKWRTSPDRVKKKLEAHRESTAPIRDS